MSQPCTPPSRILLPYPGAGVPDPYTSSQDFNPNAEPLSRISAVLAEL